MTNEQTNLKALSEQLLQLANDEGTAQIHDVAIQIAAVTDKMRNAVIEECAKIADDEQARAAERQKIETEKNGNIIYGLPGILAALIATRIRQLKYALPQPAQAPAVTKLGLSFVQAMDIAEDGLRRWREKDHNKKWWRVIDGTPIFW